MKKLKIASVLIALSLPIFAFQNFSPVGHPRLEAMLKQVQNYTPPAAGPRCNFQDSKSVVTAKKNIIGSKMNINQKQCAAFCLEKHAAACSFGAFRLTASESGSGLPSYYTGCAAYTESYTNSLSPLNSQELNEEFLWQLGTCQE